MTDQPRRKQEVYICCLTCGYTDKAFALLDERDIPRPRTRCPKCSKTAHTGTIQGLFSFMEAVTLEIVRIKSDVFDIQAGMEGGSHD